MTVFGVTGHQALPAEVERYVQAAMAERIRAAVPVTGVSSLAAGADQLFAEAIVARKGELRAVIPARGYASTFAGTSAQGRYQRLLGQAASVETLEFAEPSEKAFLAAGKRVVDLAEELLAVWDGRPAKGIGGTAEIVAYARETNKPVDVIWPPGARR